MMAELLHSVALLIQKFATNLIRIPVTRIESTVANLNTQQTYSKNVVLQKLAFAMTMFDANQNNSTLE